MGFFVFIEFEFSDLRNTRDRIMSVYGEDGLLNGRHFMISLEKSVICVVLTNMFVMPFVNYKTTNCCFVKNFFWWVN